MNLNLIKVLVLHNSPLPWCIVQVACVEILIFFVNSFNSQGQQRLSVSRGVLWKCPRLQLLPRTGFSGADSQQWHQFATVPPALEMSARFPSTDWGRYMGFQVWQVHGFLSMVLILGSWKFIVNRCSRTYVAVLSGPHLNWSHCNVLFPQSYQLCKLKLYLSRD